ncbi:MAG: hypothetical protein KDE47_00230, partial [Caldilineaceae bacterium]|nr:hypothetical protein [Caldilineaceae bacterium]
LSALGQAEEVQAIRSGFTLIGGKGRPAAVRQRSVELRNQIPQAAYGRDRNRLVERSGKLLGGVALLKVGGATDTERDYLRDRAKEAVNVVRLALDGGVVPGGGVAYLAALSALAQLKLSGEEAVAVQLMGHALQAPLCAIVQNAGVDPAPIRARICAAEPGVGYDVQTHTLTDMIAAGIIDPLPVVTKALDAGVSGALMAITTDTLVSKPRHNRDEKVDFRV